MVSKKDKSVLLDVISAMTPDEIADLVSKTPGWKKSIEQDFERIHGVREHVSYLNDPVGFIQDILGYKLWSKQIDIAESIRDNSRTVVSSGHAAGKSLIAAAVVCWWIAVHPGNAVVVTLAPTANQVNNILWRYIRKSAREKNLPGITLDTPRWNIGETYYAIGISPRRTSVTEIAGMQGFHNANLLVVMDEAAGLPKIMFDAVRNLATSTGNKILAIGNPISQSGPFWTACNSRNWEYIQINCLEHPNVTENKEVIPGAVSHEWVESMVIDHCTPCDYGTPGSFIWKEQWYTPNAVFQSRVLGIAPSEADDQLIPPSWVFSAQNIEDVSLGNERIIGLDPARQGGDDSTMVCRDGGKIIFIERKRPASQDISAELAGWLKAKIEQYEVNRAFVDEIGSGVGIIDVSRSLGLPVMGVNVSRPAQNKRRFVNQRAEIYWRLREAVKKQRLQIPDDDLLVADMSSVKYTYDYLGRVELENKQAVRQRIGRSPDTSDALALTFAVEGIETSLDDPDYLGSIGEIYENRMKQVSRWTVGVPDGDGQSWSNLNKSNSRFRRRA